MASPPSGSPPITLPRRVSYRGVPDETPPLNRSQSATSTDKKTDDAFATKGQTLQPRTIERRGSIGAGSPPTNGFHDATRGMAKLAINTVLDGQQRKSSDPAQPNDSPKAFSSSPKAHIPSPKTPPEMRSPSSSSSKAQMPSPTTPPEGRSSSGSSTIARSRGGTLRGLPEEAKIVTMEQLTPAQISCMKAKLLAKVVCNEQLTFRREIGERSVSESVPVWQLLFLTPEPLIPVCELFKLIAEAITNPSLIATTEPPTSPRSSIDMLLIFCQNWVKQNQHNRLLEKALPELVNIVTMIKPIKELEKHVIPLERALLDAQKAESPKAIDPAHLVKKELGSVDETANELRNYLFFLFSQLTPHHFVKDKHHITPAPLKAIIDFNEKMIAFFICYIRNKPDTVAQAEAITYCLELGHLALESQNFCTAFAIGTIWCNSDISKSSGWQIVKENPLLMQYYEEQNEFCLPFGNFSTIRKRLRDAYDRLFENPTDQALYLPIINLAEQDYLHLFDATAPIVMKGNEPDYNYYRLYMLHCYTSKFLYPINFRKVKIYEGATGIVSFSLSQ